jgi:hypothetical protein
MCQRYICICIAKLIAAVQVGETDALQNLQPIYLLFLVFCWRQASTMPDLSSVSQCWFGVGAHVSPRSLIMFCSLFWGKLRRE